MGKLTGKLPRGMLGSGQKQQFLCPGSSISYEAFENQYSLAYEHPQISSSFGVLKYPASL